MAQPKRSQSRVSALFRAQIMGVAVMAATYLGCLLALMNSYEKLFWLCLGAAIIADCVVLISYRHHLKIQRQQRGKSSKQIAAHGSHVF
jgi:hypothetical protein